MNGCFPAGIFQFLSGGLWSGQPQILRNGVMKQIRILRDESLRMTQGVCGKIPDVTVSGQNLARLRIPETHQQPQQGALPQPEGPQMPRILRSGISSVISCSTGRSSPS